MSSSPLRRASFSQRPQQGCVLSAPNCSTDEMAPSYSSAFVQGPSTPRKQSTPLHLSNVSFRDIPLRKGVVAVVPAFGDDTPPTHSGKVALVTGGTGGLGKELCQRLGQLGFTVVLTARNEAEGEAEAARLREKGFDVWFEKVDVTRPEDSRALAVALTARYGGLDVLVHCAGVNLDAVAPGDSPSDILHLTDERFSHSMEINALGPFRLSRDLVPLLSARAGRIINISSDLASSASMGADFPSYRLAKSVLNTQSLALAGALKTQNVSVNCVSPGWVKTRMGGPHAPATPLEGVQVMLWLATCEKVPTGGFFRRVTDVPPPQNMVEMESVPW